MLRFLRFVISIQVHIPQQIFQPGAGFEGEGQRLHPADIQIKGLGFGFLGQVTGLEQQCIVAVNAEGAGVAVLDAPGNRL